VGRTGSGHSPGGEGLEDGFTNEGTEILFVHANHRDRPARSRRGVSGRSSRDN
jgi:hypothetical protein